MERAKIRLFPQRPIISFAGFLGAYVKFIRIRARISHFMTSLLLFRGLVFLLVPLSVKCYETI